MRRLSFIIIIFLCSFLHSTAQTSFTLKIQFQHAEHGMLRKFRVSVNNQLLSTNDSGMLKVVLPRSLTFVKVTLPMSDDILLYPPDGHLPIPKDLKEVPLVITGKPETHIQLKKYLELFRLKERSAGEKLTEVKRQLDSMRLQLFRSNVPESIIRSAEQEGMEKRSYIYQLMADITAFRNSISDFRYNYKYLAGKAFEEGAALDTLIQSVSRYNHYYNKLERVQARYETSGMETWNNPSVSDALIGYADFVVNKVHAPGIYPMQEALLQIRQYYSGKKKNKNTRKSIEMQTENFIAGIDQILPEMDSRTSDFLAYLALH